MRPAYIQGGRREEGIGTVLGGKCDCGIWSFLSPSPSWYMVMAWVRFATSIPE